MAIICSHTPLCFIFAYKPCSGAGAADVVHTHSANERHGRELETLQVERILHMFVPVPTQSRRRQSDRCTSLYVSPVSNGDEKQNQAQNVKQRKMQTQTHARKNSGNKGKPLVHFKTFDTPLIITLTFLLTDDTRTFESGMAESNVSSLETSKTFS